MYGAPTIGTCRQYSLSAAYNESETSAEVDCATQHTAKVFAVVQLPDSLGWDASPSQLEIVMTKNCFPAIDTLLGRTEAVREKSAYSINWFLPTEEQRSYGARWIRCDAALLGGRALMPLPSNTEPMLPGGALPKSISLCLSGQNHIPTVCSKTHDYRATNVTAVVKDSYPGLNAMQKIASNRCPKLVSTPRNWWATFAARSGWVGGNHSIVCYSHKSN
jgi:hypothetical protein